MVWRPAWGCCDKDSEEEDEDSLEEGGGIRVLFTCFAVFKCSGKRFAEIFYGAAPAYYYDHMRFCFCY